jgi:Ser/Thr protein kinase RdoA (MazF antagonist)
MPSDPAVRGIHAEQGEQALARWDIGLVQHHEPLAGGSRSSPKWVVTTPRGQFVLKRRAPGRDRADRLSFSHAFMEAAVEAGVPVAAPLRSREGDTFVCVDNAVFELFPRVSGGRWTRTAEEALQAGEALGRLHAVGLEMAWHGHVQAGSFHASLVVMEALRRVPQAVCRADPTAEVGTVGTIVAALGDHYQRASSMVEDRGIGTMDSQVVHGDFHPGNLLFDRLRLAAVIDFDAARLEPAVMDFANGLLQFAARSGPGAAIDQWPCAFHEARFMAFAQGYVRFGDRAVRRAAELVPPLMMEACIAETAISIAKDGRFGTLRALPVLTLVRRRCDWIASEAVSLQRRLLASLA